MATMFYHENFRRLYRAEADCYAYSSSSFHPYMAYDISTPANFITIDGTTRVLLAASSMSSASNAMGNMYAVQAKLLAYRTFGYDSINAVYSTTWKPFTLGNYSGSWNSIDVPQNRVSVDDYALSSTAMNTTSGTGSLTSQVPTVTITNVSNSPMTFNYIAFTPKLLARASKTVTGTNTYGFFMWAYILDSAATLQPGDTYTISFSPWAS